MNKLNVGKLTKYSLNSYLVKIINIFKYRMLARQKNKADSIRNILIQVKQKRFICLSDTLKKERFKTEKKYK